MHKECPACPGLCYIRAAFHSEATLLHVYRHKNCINNKFCSVEWRTTFTTLLHLRAPLGLPSLISFAYSLHNRERDTTVHSCSSEELFEIFSFVVQFWTLLSTDQEVLHTFLPQPENAPRWASLLQQQGMESHGNARLPGLRAVGENRSHCNPIKGRLSRNPRQKAHFRENRVTYLGASKPIQAYNLLNQPKAFHEFQNELSRFGVSPPHTPNRNNTVHFFQGFFCLS